MDQPAGTWRWGRAAWCPVWRCTEPGTRGGSDWWAPPQTGRSKALRSHSDPPGGKSWSVCCSPLSCRGRQKSDKQDGTEPSWMCVYLCSSTWESACTRPPVCWKHLAPERFHLECLAVSHLPPLCRHESKLDLWASVFKFCHKVSIGLDFDWATLSPWTCSDLMHSIAALAVCSKSLPSWKVRFCFPGT